LNVEEARLFEERSMTARDLEEFVKESEGGLLFERSQLLNRKTFKSGSLLTDCIQSTA
jgi:hypothetical protein